MDDEGDLLIPQYNLLNRFHSGGQYSHLIGSGVDVIGSFLVGGAYLSLDRFLLDVFPLWIGIAFHKTLVFGLGAWGTYLVCRRGFHCSRAASATFSALFTVTYYRLQIVTFGTGMSFALLPLGIYLCVVRLGRPRYLLGVIAYAALCAIMFSPFHGIPPVAAAIAGGAVLLRRLHVKILVAIGTVAAAILINHAETFFGLLAVSPYSVRGLGDSIVRNSIFEIFISNTAAGVMEMRFTYPVSFFIVLISGAIFAFDRQWALLTRSLTACAVPPAMVGLFPAMPWELLNMEVVRNAPYNFFVAGFLPLAVLIGAKAADLFSEKIGAYRDGRWRGAPYFTILIVAGVILADFKIHNARAWIASAGQSVYTTIDNLREKSWMPAEPFRAVSIRHKQMQPEQNVFFGFYGIPMFDGWVNLPLREHAAYMVHGVHKDGSRNHDIGLDWRFISSEGGGFHYRIGEQVSLLLLASANVRYIFSPVPLSSDGLRYIDGPSRPPLDKGLTKVTGQAARYEGPSWRFTLDRWRWQLARIFHYGKIYIYEIDGALPRVYAARGISIVSDDADWRAFLSQVEKSGPHAIAVVRARDASVLGTAAPTARVLDFKLIRDGFDVSVDAPDGGVIVVNATYQPFFTATADGRPASLISVNGVQIAVPIPPGVRALRIIYRRPSAGEKVGGVLCGFADLLRLRLCS